MSHMNNTRQAQLRELLRTEKRRLWKELRVELFDTLAEDLNKQYAIPQDLGDRSVLAFLEDTGLAIADIRRDQLTKLDDALSKLAEGSYGICTDCGKEIDAERLQVQLYATHCVICQQGREIREKQTI